MNFHCPGCEQLSDLVLNDEQAFCRNESCKIFMFNPSLPDRGMSNVQTLDIFDAPFQFRKLSEETHRVDITPKKDSNKQ